MGGDMLHTILSISGLIFLILMFFGAYRWDKKHELNEFILDPIFWIGTIGCVGVMIIIICTGQFDGIHTWG